MRLTFARLGVLAAAVATVIVPAPVSTARASTFDYSGIYAFGDSLVDTGNDFIATGGAVPPASRYAPGRFSNGDIWVEQLADQLGIDRPVPSVTLNPLDPLPPSASFGFGGGGTGAGNQVIPVGAAVPGALQQAHDVANLPGSLDPNALYVVWAGANDYLLDSQSDTDVLYDLNTPNDTVLNPDGFVPNPVFTAGNIVDAVSELAADGAVHFLIPNLPDLGELPLTDVLPQFVQDDLSLATQAHNALLEANLGVLEQTLGLEITLLDVASLLADVLNDPTAFGFSGAGPGPASGCLFALPGTEDCSLVDLATDQVFWDEVHPTTALHGLIAAEARAALDIPEPNAVAFLVVGVALAAARARRRANAA